MMSITSVFGKRGSLRRNLVLSIITALSLCLLMAGAVVFSEFYEHLEESLEDALFEEAKELVGQVDREVPDLGLPADALRFQGVEGLYRYTVFDASGAAVVGDEGKGSLQAQLKQTVLGQPRKITLPGERVGVALRARIKGNDVIVLVSTYPTSSDETSFQQLLHEIEEQIIWIALGILMVLGAAILTTRNALSSLDILSTQAAQVGPLVTQMRLDKDKAPVEFAPLIASVNGAFDRLEAGYKAQQDFSSNVAHEIRTPIAVLKSSVDRIQDGALKASLMQDVTQIEEMFGQLIDLARADTALQSSFAEVDLRALAVVIATDMAQAALRDGCCLSVTGAESAKVHASAGLLEIALRNMIRNALQYSPKGSDVEITVTDNPAGWRVLDRGPGVPDVLKTALFERFNRGAQAHSDSRGSGIGLAIVKSVAQSHHASATVQDRPGGGSDFTFEFAHPPKA